MRIATFVNSRYTTPAPKNIVYAPMDIAVLLSMGLEKRGHQVTFFAPQGSRVNVSKVEDLGLEPLEIKKFGIDEKDFKNIVKLEQLYDQYFLAKMFNLANNGEFDILHIHPVDRALPFGIAYPKVPVVYTLHDQIDAWKSEMMRLFQSKNQHIVSISDQQRELLKGVNFAGTVYNGVDTDTFAYSDKNDNYFLFTGRLTVKKGADDAILAAKETGERLMILGVADLNSNYWSENIEPNLNDKITFQGYTEVQGRVAVYQKAKAAIFPFHWEEPFGLVMAEALSCGTPVVAYARGSAPEIVKDGVTGFLINSTDSDIRGNWVIKKTGVAGLIEAMKRINSMSGDEYPEMRKNSRKHIEDNFTIEKMVDGYEKIYNRVISEVR